MLKVTEDCSPQASSLPATQVKAPQEPVNTPNLVSKVVPMQVLTVILVPAPTMVYQTPPAVPSAVPQVPTASMVAPTVVPVTAAPPQLSGMALAQRSLTGKVLKLATLELLPKKPAQF